MKSFKVCILVVCCLAICIVLLPLKTGLTWEKSINFMAMWLTTCGFGLTIWQISTLKSQNEIIKTTVESTTSRIDNIAEIVDFSSHEEVVGQIMAYLGAKKWEIAHLKLQQIASVVARIEKNPENYGTTSYETEVMLNNINNGLQTLNRCMVDPERIDMEKLRNHLDIIKTFLSSVSHFTKHKDI